MSTRKVLTIGLGGATCSGKSTLARLLCSLFGESCQKLNQDDYYFSETYNGHTFIPEFNHINWELESAFDNAKLVKTVKDIVEKQSTTSDKQFSLFGASFYNLKCLSKNQPFCIVFSL